MTQGVVYQNAEGKIITANSAAEKILGLSYDQMTGRTSLDPRWKAIHEDGSEFLGESHPAMVALNTGERVKDALMGILNPEKETYQWINVNAVPVYREGEEKPYQVYTTFEDITERKRTEEELRDSEAKYSSLFHRSNDAIFIHDLDGKIIEANQKVLQLFGYTSSEILSIKINMFHPAEALEKSKWAFDTIIQEGFVRFEIEFKKKNDEVFCAEVSSSLFEIGGKKVIQGIVRDITERKQAEEVLRESEARHRELFVSNPNPMWIYDLESLAFLDVNNAAISHYGYSREEFLSMTLKDISPAEDVPRLLDNVKRVSDGLDKAGIWFHTRKDGSVIEVEITSHVLLFDQRQAEMVMVRDITERRLARESLKISERRYRTLFEKTTDAIFIVEQSTGRYLDANLAAIRLTGRRLSELKQMTTKDVTPVGYSERLDISAKSNKTKELGKVIYLRPDGTHRMALLTTVPLDSEAIIGIARDITDEVAMEDKLRQAQKMEAIGTLAGGIAHDFNNILVPLMGYSEMLKEDLPTDSPLQGHIDEILHAALRSKDLVKQILAFSRQGNQDIKPIKLQPIVKEALKLLRSSIPTTIDIQQDVAPDCGVVIADPTQVHQIVMNLATNAFHAMEETGGRLKVHLKKVQMGTDQSSFPELIPGEYALLTVSDTGTGIKKDVMDKIFDPYFTTKNTGKGTGLGLSVVQGIVKSCNGDIRIHSEPGKGTEIDVYLPIMVRKVDDIQRDRSEPMLGGTEKILLVDDEEVIVRMERQMLERLGYRVTVRTGSLDAYEAFKAHPESFDLVVTDMTMPNMTGVQLTEKIKKIRPDIPVILCTGFSHQINNEKSKALGIQGFIMKPVLIREIAEAIRKVLNISAAWQ